MQGPQEGVWWREVPSGHWLLLDCSWVQQQRNRHRDRQEEEEEEKEEEGGRGKVNPTGKSSRTGQVTSQILQARAMTLGGYQVTRQ